MARFEERSAACTSAENALEMTAKISRASSSYLDVRYFVVRNHVIGIGQDDLESFGRLTKQVSLKQIDQLDNNRVKTRFNFLLNNHLFDE